MAEEEGVSRGAGRAVEVLGAPPELPDMLLLLYFENRRRSGGGPVRSCRRRGRRALLTFEAADDAQRVLSRSDHVLQGHHLEVRPAAPRDNQKLLLQGLDPRTGLELLELYVERMLNCENGSYRIYRSRTGDQALVQLKEPLRDTEFPALVERVQSRPLDGVSLAVDWLEQTNSLLVRSCDGSQLKADLLELYFESRRSGGGQVLSVRVLQGGRTAMVSFQDCAVAGRVLLRPHQLANNVLDVSPYYDFLEPEEEEQPQPGAGGRASPAGDGTPQTVVPIPDAAVRQLLLQSERVLQELGGAVPECALQLDEAGLLVSGGGPADRRRLQQHIQAALQRVERERLPFAAWDLCFLQREDVRTCLAQRLDEQGLGACYVATEQEVLVVGLGPSAARQAASLLSSCLSPFTLPLSERQLLALTSPRWEQVRAALRCCLVRLAESGERLEGLTLAGLEQENTGRLLAFLQDSVPDETLVAMEPGALSYLQCHYQEVLAGIANVTLLPLEGTDVTGLRLSGEAQACQAAAELLHSLLGAIHSRTVQLQMPGVNRFLLDERGQALVRALEKRFPCTVGLEKVYWRPMEAQHDLEMSQEPLALSCRRDNLHPLQPPGGVIQAQCEVSTEEIKDLLAALQPLPIPDAEAEVGALAGDELSFVPAPVPDPTGSVDPSTMEEGPLLHPGARRPSEEEAQLFLAIQQSMDTARREEDEFQRATELSLRSWEQERARSPDAALLSAVSLSLQDVEQDVGSAELVIYAASEAEAEAASRELETALRAQLREETVHSRALQALPPLGLDYLNHLERKHAVRISVAGSVATVCGFADYPVAATRDLALLLTRLLRAEECRGAVGACWVHWDAPGTGSPTPYSAEASALLEQAWREGSKRLDVFFDGRPFTVDFERMEEYDLSNARTVPIGRTETPLRPAMQGEPGSLAAQEEEVKLVPLAEGCEEFQEMVRHFYRTLEDFYSRICIVKVEKLWHPLLYQQYQLKKAAMEKGSGQQKVERVLFHGTTEQASREICQHGFNRSFCGRNATLYGHGVYFATKAFISAQDKYSPCSSNGDKYIFVARTLVGEFTAGNQSMRAPPLRPGSDTPQRYDSTVDNPRDPTIFVIFNDTQAYPQYLITCRWSKAR